MPHTFYSSNVIFIRSGNKYTIRSSTSLSSSFNGKAFGIGKASFLLQKDDMVVERGSGWRYKCTDAGYSSSSTVPAYFTYDGISAVVKPPAPKNLSTPTRSNTTYSSKWTAANTDAKNASRPSYVWTEWYVNWAYGEHRRAGKFQLKTKVGAGASSSSFNLNDFIDSVSKIRYTRNSFYPYTWTYVNSITCSVGNYNEGGNTYSSATYKFQKPRKPTIGQWAFNKANGEVSFHVKTNEGKDAYERADTRIIVSLKGADGKVSKLDDITTTSLDWTKAYDLAGYAGLNYSQYLQVIVETWSRGLVGDSDHVTSSFYVAFPAMATVKSTSVTGTGLESRFTANISTNSTAEHFVEQVKLEYLADVTYATAADIPGTLEWTDSGIVDDAQCTALSVAVQNLIPSPGKYTWFRVKTWCRNEDVLYRYTEPQRIKALETPAPTAQDEEVEILEALNLPAAYNDGKTVALVLGWNKDGQDDATGTELTWSTDVNAWRSVTAPSEYEFTWSDGQLVHGGTTYHDSATIYIPNLEENVPVFFKARRYMVDEDENITYSDYSNTFTATPTILVAASEVNVSVISDAAIPADKAFQVEWSYDSAVVQEQFQVMATSGVTILSGTGTNQACQIPADRLKTFAVDGRVTYVVRVLVNGAWIKSATRTVDIIPLPELTIDVPVTLTAQPIEFDAECDQPVSLRVVVTSEGIDGQRPGGVKRQANGDIIYSAIVEPDWTLAEGVNTATIELPSGLELFNNGNYTIEATPINTYGIEGAAQSSTTNVEWLHPAGLPNATITTINETDEVGHTMAVQIELAAPEDADVEDLYDIYRVTGDGATLIMEGVEQTGVVIDRCAPFGSVPTYVRIATRTEDGDTNYFDYYYELAGDFLRIDWADQYVELPYNLNIQDAYTKDVEIRQHMDGTQDGYWNTSISRNASLGSTLVQVWQQADVDKLRALARYTGAAFVRTPDGSAYTADVQVTDLTPDGNRLTTVALSATEIDLVESFMAELVEEE